MITITWFEKESPAMPYGTTGSRSHSDVRVVALTAKRLASRNDVIQVRVTHPEGVQTWNRDKNGTWQAA